MRSVAPGDARGAVVCKGIGYRAVWGRVGCGTRAHANPAREAAVRSVDVVGGRERKPCVERLAYAQAADVTGDAAQALRGETGGSGGYLVLDHEGRRVS